MPRNTSLTNKEVLDIFRNVISVSLFISHIAILLKTHLFNSFPLKDFNFGIKLLMKTFCPRSCRNMRHLWNKIANICMFQKKFSLRLSEDFRNNFWAILAWMLTMYHPSLLVLCYKCIVNHYGKGGGGVELKTSHGNTRVWLNSRRLLQKIKRTIFVLIS